MTEEKVKHESSGLCWCGQCHSHIVEMHHPAPEWAPTTSDDVDEDYPKEGLDIIP